jgi:hypothetical protein
MNTDALQGADALLVRLTSSTQTMEAPARGSSPSRAGEAGAQRPAGAAVEVVHPANGTGNPRGSERPWWRRVFCG